MVGLLEGYFGDYVDITFTARMEQDLDAIASGEADAVPWLKKFYFGNGDGGLHDLVSDQALEAIDPRTVNTFPVGTDPDGSEIVARCGQYGPYLARGEDRASIPDDFPIDELNVEKATEFLEAPADEACLPHFEPPVGVGEGDLWLSLFRPVTARGRLGVASPMVLEMFGYPFLDGWRTWAEIAPETAHDLHLADGDEVAFFPPVTGG